MAGIVTALVLGMLTMVWVIRREPVHTEEMLDVGSFINTVHTLGNAALLIGALLSLAGHRAGNGMVRTVSLLMIPAVCVGMLMAWDVTAPVIAQEHGDTGRGLLGAMVALSTALQLAPWLLYLYLFRSSRYP